MNSWDELWQYMCEKGSARNAIQFYVDNPNDIAKAFWNGILTGLEMEGKITKEEGNNIWCDVDKDFAKRYKKIKEC